MAVHRKVYRFRIRPTPTQKQAMAHNAGVRRFIWNWGLAKKTEHYKATGKTLRYVDLNRELTRLKRQSGMEWLRDADSQSLQEALRDLDRAFVNFFEKRARFPRFKSRKRDKARFRIPQRVKVANGRVYCPKVGWVRIRQSQPVDEPTKSATFIRDARGNWYVSLVAEFDMPDVRVPTPTPDRTVGIDLGLIDFATLSDGTKPIPAPRFYRKGQRKLRRAQRHVSRCVKGSKRHTKAKARVARVHDKITNQRKDFLHKLTTALVRQHDGLCIEDLSLRGLARTKLAKSFADASFGEFRRQLAYKCEWNQKTLVVVDRFFPSSRLCNTCGAINEALTLKNREWDCACGVHHKRDFLAACNIRDEGIRMLAVGHTGQPKRSGRHRKTRESGLVPAN